jgi:hypothetical protein
MTLAEALSQIERLGRGRRSASISQKEALCPETQAAVRILARAFHQVQKRDPIYGQRRRTGYLAPPAGRVLPG